MLPRGAATCKIRNELFDELVRKTHPMVSVELNVRNLSCCWMEIGWGGASNPPQCTRCVDVLITMTSVVTMTIQRITNMALVVTDIAEYGGNGVNGSYDQGGNGTPHDEMTPLVVR